MYKEVITDLGVEFSAPKTYESKHFFEFAKRLFYKGVEISPFPVSGLAEVTSKYYLFVTYLMDAERKGWIASSGVPQAIKAYHEHMSNLPSSLRKKIGENAGIVENIIKMIRNPDQAEIFLMEAFRSFGYSFNFKNTSAIILLEMIIVECFIENQPYRDLLTKKLSPLDILRGVVTPPGEKDTMITWMARLPGKIIQFTPGSFPKPDDMLAANQFIFNLPHRDVIVANEVLLKDTINTAKRLAKDAFVPQ